MRWPGDARSGALSGVRRARARFGELPLSSPCRILGVVLAIATVGCDGPTVVGDGGVDARVEIECTSDSECTDDLFCNGIERCEASRCRPGTDPCGGRACDEVAGACAAPECPDADGDGHTDIACGGDDCDDANAERFPGNSELCDRADQDCDSTSLGQDADGDSFVSSACCNPDAEGIAVCGTDCDDRMRGVNPGATEACNGVDDDCDGMIDEDVELTFYRDVDGDGFGRSDMSARGCSLLTGYAFMGGDCDDMSPGINPGESETCNEVDDDCDGTVDPGCACTSGVSRPCGPSDGMGGILTAGICRAGTQACIEGAWADCAGAVDPEVEDCEDPPVDDDCDGVANEGVDVECFVDADNDTYAPLGAELQRLCPSPDPARVPYGRCPFGYTSRAPVDAASTDCADTGSMASTINPVGRETCNALDDDCNGAVDDGSGAPFTCYTDGDGDGYAPMGASAMTLCVCPVRTTTRAPTTPATTDCDDAAISVHPGVAEVCDGAGVDEDCDGMVNEGCACTPGASRMCPDPGVCAAGTQTCMGSGGSASWGACSITPVTEVCDGRDEDCDGTVDDGFACPRGETRSCTGSCAGVSFPGTQTCRSDCAGWGVCTGAEVCNGCDDDLDGVADDGFACVRGATAPCTTMCGTSGTQTCVLDCSGFSMCRAATETCNFCDDVGDLGDDSGVSGTRTVNASCANITVASGATCSGSNLFVADSSVAWDERWGTFGTVRVGWGAVTLRATWTVSDPFGVGGAPTYGLVMMITNNASTIFLRRSVWLQWDFQAGRIELWGTGGSSPIWTTATPPGVAMTDGVVRTNILLELVYRPGSGATPPSLEARLPDFGWTTAARTVPASAAFGTGETVYGRLEGWTEGAPFSAWAQMSATEMTYLRAESTCP